MVDSAVVARGGVVKHLKIEKPRPLRSDPDQICINEILKLAEEVGKRLTDSRNDLHTRKKVQQLKELLRLNGQAVERTNKDCLDKLEVDLREACLDISMDIITRLNVLEIIELRLNNWVSNPAMANMYKQKMAEATLDIDMKKIGYEGFREVNEDSSGGNLLINGDGVSDCNQNHINMQPPHTSKSDLRCLSNAGDAAAAAFTTSLVVNGNTINLSSNDKDLVNTSKEVLLEFFTIIEDEKIEREEIEGDDEDECSSLVFAKPEISYEREELMSLSKSPLCGDTPFNWDKISNDNPYIVKKAGAPSKHFLREVELIRKQEAARKM